MSTCTNMDVFVLLCVCLSVCLCLHPLQCCLPGWILWCRYLCKYYLLVWHCMLHRHLCCFCPVPKHMQAPKPSILIHGFTFRSDYGRSQETIGYEHTRHCKQGKLHSNQEAQNIYCSITQVKAMVFIEICREFGLSCHDLIQ